MVKKKKVTRFISAAFWTLKFPFSGDKGVFVLLHTGRIFFIWEIDFLLSGGQRWV